MHCSRLLLQSELLGPHLHDLLRRSPQSLHDASTWLQQRPNWPSAAISVVMPEAALLPTAISGYQGPLSYGVTCQSVMLSKSASDLKRAVPALSDSVCHSARA